jgi:hypothetical protein
LRSGARGFLIAETSGAIKRINDTKYIVKSQNGNGDYDVCSTDLGWVCSCPDHKFRGVKCKMRDYDGPDIDWSGFNQQFMSAQLAKSVGFFTYLDKKMEAMDDDIKKQKNHKRTKHPTK